MSTGNYIKLDPDIIRESDRYKDLIVVGYNPEEVLMWLSIAQPGWSTDEVIAVFDHTSLNDHVDLDVDLDSDSEDTNGTTNNNNANSTTSSSNSSSKPTASDPTSSSDSSAKPTAFDPVNPGDNNQSTTLDDVDNLLKKGISAGLVSIFMTRRQMNEAIKTITKLLRRDFGNTTLLNQMTSIVTTLKIICQVNAVKGIANADAGIANADEALYPAESIEGAIKLLTRMYNH